MTRFSFVQRCGRNGRKMVGKKMKDQEWQKDDWQKDGPERQ